MRRWLPYLVFIALSTIAIGVWQFVFHGVDPGLIFNPPPQEAAPPDVSKLVSIDATSMPLKQVLADLSRQTGVNIEFDPSALALPGVATTSIDLHVDDIPLEQAIHLALVNVSGVEFQLHDGKVLIVDGSVWDDNERAESRIYPLGPLLADSPSLSVEALADSVERICDLFHPYFAGAGTNAPRQLPGGLLVTAPPRVHRRVEQLLAALRQPRPAAGQTQQARRQISAFPPSEALLARLEQPVDLDLIDVPFENLAQELERQWKIPVRASHAALGMECSVRSVALRARQRPLREILAELENEGVYFAPFGDILWLSEGGFLDQGEIVAIYPVGDLLSAISHPSAPQTRGEFARWIEAGYDNNVLLGDLLVSFVDSPPDPAEVEANLRALRETIFGSPNPNTDWRAHVALSEKLARPLTLVCDEPRLSQRLAKLAEVGGIQIELDPALDLPRARAPRPPPPAEEGDPFGNGSPSPAPRYDTSRALARWDFDAASLDTLDVYLALVDISSERTPEGLRIVPRWQRESVPFDGFRSYHRLEGLLTAAAGRLSLEEIRGLLYTVAPTSDEQPGTVFELAQGARECHFAAAEMLDKLCQHARTPEDRTPWKIESMRLQPPTVFPIDDLREEITEDDTPTPNAQVIGGYLVVPFAGDVPYVDRLLAALRAPPAAPGERKPVVLSAAPEEEWATRGVVVCEKWYRGFGADASYTVLYESPEIARLHQPIMETYLPPAHIGPFYSFWTATSSPASAEAVWNIRLDFYGHHAIVDMRGPIAEEGAGYQIFGDHIALTATPAGHARFERRWREITRPDLLHEGLPTITLQASDEPLLTALDRWSRAARRPVVILDAGGLKEKLQTRTTLSVQDQPFAEFVREHLYDAESADPIEVRDDDCALLIAPRSEFTGDTTRLFDLRPIRAKLPEMDDRQLVHLIMNATNRGVSPVGDVLVVRLEANIVEQIDVLLKSLASDEIDRLPRPALLFADDPTPAKERFLAVLAAKNPTDFLACYSAFWLAEGPALSAADLQPLIATLANLHAKDSPAQTQAICRVLAAHRGSAGAALDPLVAHCGRPAPEDVRATLIATLACLGEKSVLPLAELLVDSHGEESRQIVHYLWFQGDAARPAVPRILEWAFIEQDQPDAVACRGVFVPARGLLMRLDPRAEQTRAVMTSWRNHSDAQYQQAFAKADKFFQAWPAYLGEEPPELWPAVDPPFHAQVQNAFWKETP